MDDNSKIELMSTNLNDLSIFHFGLGIWIRNNILKDNSAIFRLLQKNGYKQKDDMSSFIISELYKYLLYEKTH